MCGIIIDEGSCTNAAITYLVDKFGLKTEPHASPYSLHWLDDCGKVKVNERVLVSLSIERYKEDIWCDVVPMKASHVLLGRPWEFDMRVVRDGKTNRYSFDFVGKRIVLAPLSP